MKKAHPALSFDRATLRSVRVGDTFLEVFMAPSMDKLLDEFIAAEKVDVDFRQQRCPFGAVLWPSARALWLWLNETPSRYPQLGAHPDNPDFKVIELGCGVGFLSALLATKTHWKITASDYEPAYADFVKANAQHQGADHVDFLTLDWCERLPDHLAGQFDLVIACDVFYDDSHINTVPRIASELLKPTGSFLLADPQRFRFQTALEVISDFFGQRGIEQKTMTHEPSESIDLGVVNPKQSETTVQIIHCQNPHIKNSLKAARC